MSAETIKRLKVRIDQLEQQVSRLEKEIAELKKPPVMLLETVRGRVYHSSEKWSDTSAINTPAPVDTIRLRKDSNSPSVSESRTIALIQKSYKLGYQMFSSQIVFLRKKRCHLRKKGEAGDKNAEVLGYSDKWK